MNRLNLLLATLALLIACSNEAPVESAGESPAPPAGAEQAAPTQDADQGMDTETPMEETAPAAGESVSATETRVTGTIKGTQVEMVEAELDSQLAIFEEDSWGFSPSLLIFMFLDEGESPEGQTFSVAAGDKPSFDVTIPHVHYRWRGGDENNMETEVVSMDYDMELTFGRIENGELPGEITFSVPGEDTSVQGTFRAKVEE